jgi:hypothetical protein
VHPCLISLPSPPRGEPPIFFFRVLTLSACHTDTFGIYLITYSAFIFPYSGR